MKKYCLICPFPNLEKAKEALKALSLVKGIGWVEEIEIPKGIEKEIQKSQGCAITNENRPGR